MGRRNRNKPRRERKKSKAWKERSTPLHPWHRDRTVIVASTARKPIPIIPRVPSEEKREQPTVLEMTEAEFDEYLDEVYGGYGMIGMGFLGGYHQSKKKSREDIAKLAEEFFGGSYYCVADHV